MNELMKKVVLVLMTMLLAVSAKAAETIDLGDGSITVRDAKIKHGVGHGYDPNLSTKQQDAKLKKRREELRAAKKKLQSKWKKAKRKDKKKIKEDIKKVSKEIDRNNADTEFENKLKTHSRKPSNRQQAEKWKKQERQDRIDEKNAEQEKWEKKQRRRRGSAVNIDDLLDLGDVSMDDIMSGQDDVMEAEEDLNDIQDEMQEEECDEIGDDNIEICTTLNQARNEASATLEQAETRLGELTNTLPPILITGGMYVISERLRELQERYRHLRSVNRELIGCSKYCDIIEDRVENLKEAFAEHESLDKEAFDEIQDEIKKEEYGGPVEAELVIPNYLAQNTDVPFGNKNELPIIFAVDHELEYETVKGATALVNNQEVELVYYPERGIFTGSYIGFDSKTDLKGNIQVELIDGEVLEGSFAGRINNEKPNVKINSTPGTVFRRGKFNIHVTGEFDKLEITGDNVKEQVIEFDEPKTSYKLRVTALRKGNASINVVATRKSKTVAMPDFGDNVLATDEVGRILRENDLYSPIDLGNGAKKELGFCCEDINEITCEGCIGGKRSRASCKALNKLPGYDFKAFLSAKDLSCTDL